MLIAGPIFGDRMLKTAQRFGPQFHAIQVPTQARKRFDQITDNHVFRGFRHGFGLCPSYLRLPPLVKRLTKVLFPDHRPRKFATRTNHLEQRSKNHRVPGFGSRRPALTSTIAAFGSISANSAGSAPVIQT